MYKAHLKVKPVGFVQLWPNEEVKVSDLVVLAHQRCRQSKLATRLCLYGAGQKRVRGYHVNLRIQGKEGYSRGIRVTMVTRPLPLQNHQACGANLSSQCRSNTG